MANISGYLSNIKNAERGEDVRDSIINALQKINEDNPSIIKPLNVTSNGTYAGEGGIVYNPVTVNVPEGAASALTLTDKVITENGDYEADDGEAYRSVTVDVPQNTNDILEEKVITDNGEFTALLDGYDGYGKVTVNVQQGNTGPHTVRFHDASGAVVQTVVNVPYGGGCVYSGPTPTSSGMRFVGFNPNPSNVKTDLDCYAKFENLVYNENQILDDWLTIAKNCRRDKDSYDIGQWKLMEFDSFQYVDYDGNDRTFPRTAVRMQLVAKGVDPLEGENGYANTTWLAMDVFPTYGYVYPRCTGGNYRADTLSWDIDSEKSLKYWLEYWLWNNGFPKEIKEYPLPVIKYSLSVIDKIYQTDRPSVGYLWIPSLKEVGLSEYDIAQGITSENLGTFYDGAFGGDLYETRKKTIYGGTDHTIYGLRSIAGLHADRWSNNYVRNVAIGNFEKPGESEKTQSIYISSEIPQGSENVLLGFCM